MGDVDVNWVKAIGDIKSVARFCHSAFQVSKLFDESWNPDHVDLIVAAKRLRRIKDQYSVAVEERDSVPEFPLQIMGSRKYWISIP